MPASNPSKSAFRCELDLDETIHVLAGGSGRVK